MADNLQDIIDSLIDHIDKAIAKGSVTNQQVAAVLDFLNERLKKADGDKYIRKDQPDYTNHILQLFDGLEIGKFFPSMTTGTGAGIDNKGNAEVESMKVRSFMMIMELIINRLSSVESEFVFSESGTIDKVEEIEANTYLLTIRKRWDFDFTAFALHDVVYGSINTLLSDGSFLLHGLGCYPLMSLQTN